MNEMQRFLLINNKKPISLDLRAEDVFSFLQSKLVLDVEEVELIRNEKTSKRRTLALMENILAKDTKAFHAFYESLQYGGYEHLAGLLLDGVDPEFQTAADSEDGDEVSYDVDGMLLDGGVPQLPKVYLSRPKFLQELHGALANLKERDGFVLIHGMVGIGKTVLASESLRSRQLLHNCFPGGIFWVSIGLVDDVKLLMKMQNLCMWLDQCSSAMLPRNLEEARMRLRLLFRKHYPRSLLVLDDVWSFDTLKWLDVRVRTLVTSRSGGITGGLRADVYKVHLNTGFNMSDAKQLLSLSTGIPLDQLPPEASTVSEVVCGSPLAIAMIGALLRQHNDRWTYYIGKLKQSQLRHIKSHIAYDSPTLYEAFSLSIETLPADLLEKFKDLVIFEEGVRIPKEVLMMLWNQEVC